VTLRLAVVGDPVDHSLSPVLHTAALRLLGVDGRYEKVRVASTDLPTFFAQARATLDGFNVTLPHKEAAARLVDELAPSARQTGAVNVVQRVGDRWVGHNTDVVAVHEALSLLLMEVSPRPRHAVLLGAGGAARAAFVALRSLHVPVTVINRTPARARALVTSLGGAEDAVREVDDGRVISPDILVQSTRVGLDEADATALPAFVVSHERTIVVEFVYRRGGTRLERETRQAQRPLVDGLSLLVGQAARSLALWLQRPIDLPAVTREMARAAEESLR